MSSSENHVPNSQSGSHRARKRFGQNFLHDQSVIDNIIQAIYPRDGDHLVEIGPGQAALTQPIIDITDQLREQQFDLIELDRDLATALGQQLSTTLQQQGRLRIHQTDALQFDFSQLLTSDTTPPGTLSVTNAARGLRIFGNLPYNISTPLIFHLLAIAAQGDSAKPMIHDMHFMLQKEVVDRMTAQPGNKSWGRLSVMTQYRCEAEALFEVPAEAFSPQPKVTSAIVRLTPRPISTLRADNEKILDHVVKTAFAQRRKTLRNTLKNLIDAQALTALSIDPACRAETLSIAQFIDIANRISANNAQ